MIRSFLLNMFLCFLSLMFTFAVLETTFYNFFIKSDSFGFTLSSRKWFQEYWKPANSLTYRDIEHPHKSLQEKKVIFVVGDSFAAGHGIKNIEDRFSDKLNLILGDGYEVINIAKNGWDTEQEYNAILEYPFKYPDTIILSYFLNDIDGAAKKNGFLRPNLVKEPEGLLFHVLENSYFVNFVYWRLYRFRNSNMVEVYWNYLKTAYFDKKIWNTHKDEIQKIINYTKINNIKLIIVLFPYFRDIERSNVITYKVKDFFDKNSILSIDVAKMFPGKDVSELIVNRLDAHPSIMVNEEVANILFDKLKDR